MTAKGAPLAEAATGITAAPNHPVVIRSSSATRRLWGNDDVGHTDDRVYVSTTDVCHIVFGLPAGARYGHLGGHDVFERDIVWHVLEGTLVASNPVNGDVWRAQAGQSLLFGGDVWLNGMNYGTERLEVIEFTAPPTAPPEARATRVPLPDHPLVPPRGLGRWPEARHELAATAGVQLVDEHGLGWHLEGQDDPILVGLVSSSDRLTVGHMEVLPGRRSDVLVRDSTTTTLHVTGGVLQLEFPHDSSWLDAAASDGIYVPPGIPHRFLNPGTAPARALFQLVPVQASNGRRHKGKSR